MMDSSVDRGAQPKQSLGFFVGRVLFIAELGQDLLDRRIRERGERTSQFGNCRVGTRLGRRSHAGSSSTLAISTQRHEIAGDSEEALALRGGMSHGTDVQIGDVAHVDDTETEPRAAGHGAVHQALHQQDRGRIVGTQNGAEHAHRIDDRQLEACLLRWR